MALILNKVRRFVFVDMSDYILTVDLSIADFFVLWTWHVDQYSLCVAGTWACSIKTGTFFLRQKIKIYAKLSAQDLLNKYIK